MAINAGTIYSEVRIAIDKLKSDISQVEINLDKFGKTNAKQATNTEKKWYDSFGKISLAGVAAFAGIALAVKTAVKTFASFEQALANVRSVAQATPSEFQAIEKAAIEAGETTRFTASQAADAMYYLASAGFDASQSMEALNGVLLLAGSTQSDLAMTSETVASAISQFNLEASDAGRVANVFTAAITNSQATMDKLAVSMRYIGPVASSMNKSIEDTVGLLQILYNNGFEASQAGTALRGALADLSNESSPAVKRLKELGVSFEEVNPLTNTYADIIDVLNEKVTNASDIMAIFGDRAGPALIKLIQGGREEVEKYTEAVTGTNAAAEAYAIQNDTLQGSIDLLKSAIESAQIKFVKEFTPAIRGIVDALTGFVKLVSDLPGPIKVFLGVIAGGIPILIGATKAIKAIGFAMTAMNGHVGVVALGVGALVGVFVSVGSAMKKAADESERFRKATEAADSTLLALNKYSKTLSPSMEVLEKRIQGVKDAQKELENQMFKQTGEITKNYQKTRTLNERLFVFFQHAGIAQVEYIQGMIDKNSEYEEALVKLDAEKARLIEEEDKRQKTAAKKREEEQKKELERQQALLKQEEERRKKEEEIARQKEQELKTIETANQKALETEADYIRKLEDLNATTQEAIELERQRAVISIDSSAADRDAKIRAIEAINEYYEALKDQTANEEFKQGVKEVIDYSFAAFQELGGGLQSLFQAIGQSRIDEIDRQMQAEFEAAGVAEENQIERLTREVSEARKAGDEETAIEKEKELKRAQIIADYEKKKAEIEYKTALSSWLIQLAMTIAQSIQAAMNAYSSTAAIPIIGPALAPGAAIAASVFGGIQVAAVGAAKPKPPKYQYGGIVEGERYQGDQVSARLNSGEMVLTRDQQARLFDVANGGGGGGITRIIVPVNIDGKKVAETVAEYYNGGVVPLT